MSVQFDEIARFVFDPKVPESALIQAALLLTDTLGVAAGAVHLEPGRIARDFAVDFLAGSATNSAPILFDGRSASVPGAAFAAATQIDNLDGHDGYNPTKGHIGCAVVPALFALAHAHPGLSARSALTALAMSYEVAARAAIALHATVTDYHTSGAWNALGVAALACHLNDTGPIILREALGIAEYHGPRSQMMREIAHPTMLHDGSGMGALTGTMAALMAMRGFQGAPAITAEAPEVADIWADLGKVWTIERNYIKPYPICRWAHAPLDALNGLMTAHGVQAKDVVRLRVNTFTQSAALFPGMPETTGQAQYSLPFALAVMLRYGQVTPEHIFGAGLQDASVAELLPRIEVTECARHSDRFPAGRWADVTLELTDGRQLSSGDVHARGGPEAPLGLDEVAAKFSRFAAPVLGQARSDAIWAIQDRLLDPATPLSELTSLLTSAP
jgi:2-methylcitrate dehydratase PrpD